MKRLILAAALSSALSAYAADKLAVTVQHDLAIARPSETITIPWSDVNAALPGALIQKIAVKDAKGGAVEFRVEKAGIAHGGIGKVSFTQEALEANVKAYVDALNRAKPSGAKGTYVKRITLSSTMGPGFKVDPASLA